MIKRVVVAGSRDFNNYPEAEKYIDLCILKIKGRYSLVFVSGNCKGADLIGEKYAKEHGYEIEIFPAEWKKYGRAAGPIRNEKMAEISDYVICFWDGKSRGTKNMIDMARKFNKEIRIKRIKN